MKGLLGLIGIIGIIILIFGNIGAIGYGLYLWGGVGMAFAVAAWTAFKLWMIVMATGLFLFLGAIFGTRIYGKKELTRFVANKRFEKF